MQFRIAAVSFLNTVPLLAGLANRDDVSLVRDLPSRLPALLQEGKADVAMLPVAEILRGKSGGILPAAGIASRGAVDSVKMFAATDPAGIERIAADRGSRSSVALLQVLLAEKYGLKPPVTEIEPRVGLLPEPGEGILIIGDRCFQYEKFLRDSGADAVCGWDLGEVWFRETGLPFVFATWAVAPGFAGRAEDDAVSELYELLAESRRQGLSELADIAAREAAAGTLGHKGYATPAAIDYYFRRSLRFTIGEEELTGISRFQELAVKHGLVPAGPLPPVLRG